MLIVSPTTFVSSLSKTSALRYLVIFNLNCTICGRPQDSLNMARHLRRQSRQRSSSVTSLLCRSVRGGRRASADSIADLDGQSVISFDSFADDIDDAADEGEERLAGLSFNAYSAAC